MQSMPKANTTFEKVNSLLNQIEYILTNEDAMPAIEADIVKGHLRDIYEFFVLSAIQHPQVDAASTTAQEPMPMPCFVSDEGEQEAHEEVVATKTTEEVVAAAAVETTVVAAAVDATNPMRPENEKEEIEAAEAKTLQAADDETNSDESAKAAETVAHHTKQEDTSAKAENEKDESLFAPPEADEPKVESLPPVMDKIEHNPFGSLFDMDEEAEPAEVQTSPAAKSEEPKEKVATPAATTPKEEKPSLRDLLRKTEDNAPKTIGEKLVGAESVAEQLATRVRHSKVSDLRTVININDKFSFMSELFHGNMKAYNDFILRLNAISDRQEALEHVRMIAQENQWNNESVTVQTFYSIFDRKF